MRKERVDKLLCARGLVESRQQAQAIIMAGQVFVNRQRVDKPGQRIEAGADIEVKKRLPFVGRGGLKLEGALRALAVDVRGSICLDVGASTGGFTDCLLQRGAGRVVALDVGKGQLHWRLRTDPRVIVVEGINARYLKSADFPRLFDLITVDVSFISLTKVLPSLVPLLTAEGSILALVKPQFEVGKGEVGPKGVVRDREKQQRVVAQIQDFAVRVLRLKMMGLVESALLGGEGNKEFFILLGKNPEAASHEVGPVSQRS